MKNKLSIKIQQFWVKTFLEQKLNNWIGYLLFFSIAAFMGYLIAAQTLAGIGLTAFVIGLAIVITCLVNTEAGLYINVIYSFFAFHFSRFFFNDNFPVGVVTDVLITATLFSLFVKRVGLKKSIAQFVHTPVVICILILYSYIAIELFNPYAHSFEAWFQTFRKSLETLVLLFIAYHVFDSYKSIKKFLTLLFIMCTITAIYGCIQQWHGLFDFEIAWVTSDDNRFGLIFIDGDFRKFSTMSDPTAYAIIMASCAVFFLIIASRQKELRTKAILIAGVIFMLLGMAYSGTRTANAMVTAGLAMFILLTINKKSTQIFAFVAGSVFLLLLYGPFYGNATINRFRTTFIGTKNDGSYQVREVNRAFIQPYIYSHPIGGGLGTTGAAGVIYNPGHPLAGFPPDSGYLKKALEAGWIGFGIICILYFLILRAGIKGYFSSKNENVKLIYAGCTAAFFCFYIAEFAQDAIGQITDMVVYYPLIAIALKLKILEKTDEDLIKVHEIKNEIT